MIIGIDIDQVLASTIEVFVEYHNEKYKTSLKMSDLTNYFFNEMTGDTLDGLFLKFDQFYASEYPDKILPLKGAVKSINDLITKNEHRLCVITSRPLSVEILTRKWLEKNFGNNLQNLYFAVLGTSRSKAEICKELGVKILIEDSLEFSEECRQYGTKVLLMDAPWNQKILIDGITRVYSWVEVMVNIETIHEQFKQLTPSEV